MLANKRAHDADKAYGESPPTGPRSEWVRCGGLAGPEELDAAVGLLERSALARGTRLRGAWCTLHVALPCCALSGGWNVAALVACGAMDREARQHAPE